ncbi:MAG: hypothetical protein ABSB12_00970 [Candidatus Saccharimonadales bacterium]
MSIPDTAVGRFCTYSAELIADRNQYQDTLLSVSEDVATQSYLLGQSKTRIAAMGLLVKQVYDMAHIEDSDYGEGRENAASLGGLALLLTDIVDDQVDIPDMPLEEKFRYLDQGMSSLLYGEVAPPETAYAANGNIQAMRASFDLATYLHQRLSDLGGIESLSAVIEPLVDDIKEQFTSRDLARQLTLTRAIGANCGVIAAVATESVDGTDYPSLIEAARGIGGYAQCLDNAYEIKKDITEGSVSYATLLLDQQGNNARNRRAARDVLTKEAQLSYEEGGVLLTHRQSVIYAAAKRLIEVKYKIYGRLTDYQPRFSLPAIAGLEGATNATSTN